MLQTYLAISWILSITWILASLVNYYSSWYKFDYCTLHSLKVMHLTLCFRMIRGYDMAWAWTLDVESKGFTSWVSIRKKHCIHMICVEKTLTRRAQIERGWNANSDAGCDVRRGGHPYETCQTPTYNRYSWRLVCYIPSNDSSQSGIEESEGIHTLL